LTDEYIASITRISDEDAVALGLKSVNSTNIADSASDEDFDDEKDGEISQETKDIYTRIEREIVDLRDYTTTPVPDEYLYILLLVKYLSLTVRRWEPEIGKRFGISRDRFRLILKLPMQLGIVSRPSEGSTE